MNHTGLENFMIHNQYPDDLKRRIREVNDSILYYASKGDAVAIKNIMSNWTGIDYSDNSIYYIVSAVSFVYFSMYMRYLNRTL